MSLNSKQIDDLVTFGSPILCVDTCTLLDVIRDITRETVILNDVRAGSSLLEAAETRRSLSILMAEQVQIELMSNTAEVVLESKRNLLKFVNQLQRIHDVALAFGALGSLQTQQFDGHDIRAKCILERWKRSALIVPHNDGVSSRAFRRVNEPRTPARKGKESMKDCVIIESYLEAAESLRVAGFSGPIVFASSNTKEYYAPNSRYLHADIASDFSAVNMNYAPNFGAAKHFLGL